MDLVLDGNLNQPMAKKIDEIINFVFNKPYKLNISNNRKIPNKFHLSFYPISKNLRMYSTIAAKNLAIGEGTSISFFPREGEYSFCKKNLNWKNWYPWIYTSNSFEKTNNNIRAWNSYFEVPKINEWNKLINSQIQFKNFELDDLIAHQIGLKVLALNLIFKFSPRFSNMINEVIPRGIVGKKYVGVHIRRGDVISKDGKISRNNWPIIPVATFAEHAKKSAEKHNTQEIFLSTDSDETVDEFIELTNGLNVHINNYDRNNFFRVSKHFVEDVETFIRKNEEIGFFYALSGLSDLFMLANASELVCTINSEFSRTAWYLALATQKQFVPFSSLYTYLDLNKRDSIFLV